jgi:hypothetical protein
MDRSGERDVVNYLDSDQYFFGAPVPVIEALKDADIAIVPHDFPKKDAYKVKLVGSFNAGAVFFAKSELAYRCVKRWREQCLDWCYDKLDNSRLGDQMYLDEWPALYGDRVIQLRGRGVNIGTWNLGNYKVSMRDGRIFLDGSPLILFHFHRLKTYLDRNKELHAYPAFVADRNIFRPYIRSLSQAVKEISALGIGYVFPEDNKPFMARLIKQHILRIFRRP